MPQMSPLWWEILFIIFFMTFIIMNSMIYFMTQNKIKQMKKDKNEQKQMNWLW
nr:TPA_asm: ATP synthase F0 subunit 8 [Dichelops melacanthus]